MTKRMESLFNIEVIGDTKKGIEMEHRQSILSGSHNALVNSLAWIKGPLFLQLEDQTFSMDMFWVSGYLKTDANKIIPVLKGNELDIELSRFDERILHVGPIFVSLYWVTSGFKELKEGKITADFPLFGATVRYKPGIAKSEVMHAYKSVRSFIEQSLKRKNFNGTCFWSFINENVISPNMFYFARMRKIVHGTDVYDDRGLDHSFYFELGDVMGCPVKPKCVTFLVSSKGKVRYDLKRMKLLFEIFNRNAKLVESIEIPFNNFVLSTRPDAFNFLPQCFEDET